MSEEPQDCPSCGALPELQSWTCQHTEDHVPFQAFQQECEECGLAGPIRASEVDAISDWNSLNVLLKGED